MLSFRGGLMLLMAFTVLPGAASAGEAPRLQVRAAVWSNGELRIDVDIPTSTGRAFVLGGPGLGWCDGLNVSVVSRDGVEQKWALKRPTGCQQWMMISGNNGAGVSFSLPPKAVAKLLPGTYEVVVTLDLTRAGGGDFRGVVRAAPVELTVGPAKAQPPVDLPATVDGLVAALDKAATQARRRELALALEARLLDAPELPPGPELDAVVKAHLAQLAHQMCTADEVYTSGDDVGRASNHLLFTAQVMVSPGRLSPDFTATLSGLPLGPATPAGFVGSAVEVPVVVAKDLSAFWRFVEKGEGGALHVFPVHVSDGVVRVATSLVARSNGPERFQHLSFWRQVGGAWKSVSFEPLPPRASTHEWTDNLHRTRTKPGGASDPTPLDRAQELEVRYDLLRITAPSKSQAGRGGARLGTVLGGIGLDKSYRPLLERRLGQGTAEQQAAVVLELSDLGSPPSTDTLVRLLPLLQVKELTRPMVELLDRQLQPRLAREARPGTPAELAALAALDGSGGRGQVKVLVLGDLALREVEGVSEGRRALFKRGPSGWAKVADLVGWVE